MSARERDRRTIGRASRLGLAVLLGIGLFAGSPSASLGSADTTAPTLILAGEAVDGPVTLDHLVLMFDEPIDVSSIPDAADFTFLVRPPGPYPSPEPTLPPLAPAVGLRLVYQGFVGSSAINATGVSVFKLDLGRTVALDDTVRVSYVPGVHPLRDLAGNLVAAFTMDSLFVGSLNGVVAFIDDGLGPDRLLLVTSRPLEPVLPSASDFHVIVNGGTPQTPTSVNLVEPGFGLGFIVLTLAGPVDATDLVTLSYLESAPALTYLAGDPIGTFVDIGVDVTLPAIPSRLTPSGTNVAVVPPDSSTGTSPVSITFQSVGTAGTTTLASSSTGPVVPAGFSFGDPPVFYNLSTTALFSSAEVCFSYSPNSFNPPESGLRLLHYEGGVWVDTTLAGYPDTVNHRICGTSTTFSPFAIAGRSPYSLVGFLAPVDNQPTVNIAKAGSAIPIKFKLGGNRGLDVFAAGSPSSQAVACSTGSPTDVIEATAAPGGATLSYDPASDTYTYVWKTVKTWRGCRTFTVAFNDGSTKTALFTFK